MAARAKSSLTITRTTFTGNSAAGDGRVYSATEGQATLSSLTFTGNSAGEVEEDTGGDLYAGGSGSIDLSAATFTLHELGGPPNPVYNITCLGIKGRDETSCQQGRRR